MNTEPAHSTFDNSVRGCRVWMMRCSGAYSFETATAVVEIGHENDPAMRHGFADDLQATERRQLFCDFIPDLARRGSWRW